MDPQLRPSYFEIYAQEHFLPGLKPALLQGLIAAQDWLTYRFRNSYLYTDEIFTFLLYIIESQYLHKYVSLMKV